MTEGFLDHLWSHLPILGVHSLWAIPCSKAKLQCQHEHHAHKSPGPPETEIHARRNVQQGFGELHAHIGAAVLQDSSCWNALIEIEVGAIQHHSFRLLDVLLMFWCHEVWELEVPTSLLMAIKTPWFYPNRSPPATGCPDYWPPSSSRFGKTAAGSFPSRTHCSPGSPDDPVG